MNGAHPLDCMPDKRHQFLPDSGWCIHGCGNRDDGRTTLLGGKVIVPGPSYSTSELQAMYANLTERTTA
ncbi:hypothetical protein [Agromyces sp. CCNWLW203]|uniref:hypothetical protein n=1 Tax=Agromyces sp. CCNWLW203 TaxID=3112842 RepID=UPI002F967A25